MDRLTAAKVFVDVAITRSFTATAERLDMSRPMVTRYVDSLENWLNVRLFHRTTRKVSLTSAGETCLPEVQGWIGQAEKLQYQLMVRDELVGKVRIAASMSFAFSQLIPAVEAFMDKHPRVEIDVDVQESAVDLVAERIDLAIRITSDPDPALIGRSLAKCESVLVASQTYLDSAPEIKRPADLGKHKCLGYRNFEHHIWHLERDRHQESVEVSCVLTSNEATTLLSAAHYGMGISLQPTYLVSGALARGELVQVLPRWRPKSLDIYALYSSRKHLPPAVRALIDHLVAFYSDREWQDIRL
ncbi:LysR family transcriptional regulator [Marinobacter halodurans]|uniref:LysR family transcriptional regulator n=1 Tax=Marinobacter halodurans TaxID=2528979 RepID=A0ABY1ZQ51_9GAMM|nr:LysR family transcriptional regulator [Marinobacter halodurans]TBW57609.1 LysR family transcriptional regulator [Marinobacter halodurans]